MPVVNLPLVQIKEFETQTLFPLATLNPGTYLVPLQIEGNSILSSLLVTNVSLDASIEVNYFQTTTGETPTERSPLVSHVVKTTASQEADTIIVARVHLKPVCEVKISGGPVTFGLMATMVSAFASDIESSLFKDGYEINGKERGLPFMTLDESDGSMRFVRAKGGRLAIYNDEGELFHVEHSDSLSVNQQKLLLKHDCYTKDLKISQLTVSSFGTMKFDLKIDGQKVATVRTTANQPNVDLKFSPFHIARRDSAVTINAERLAGSGPGFEYCDLSINGYEYINEEDMTALTKIVLNKSGSLILPFKAVAWLDDNSVTLADADAIGIADFAGVTQDGIANLGYGKISKLGELPGALVGFGAIAGQPVFLSSTPGQLTLTAPLTGTIFRIGFAEPPSGSATGEATSLFISPQLISDE